MAKPKVQGHQIKRSWCKGCGICVAFCPKEVLELDQEQKATPERASQCVGCRTCERMCPDLAIAIELEQDDDATN
ncbi:MAG: 4Fe-4S binding protein [Desulfohalobiaceae bacterium]|nr:4Fe-4S binding protein [Desulfohalobiaceae bacterium]